MESNSSNNFFLQASLGQLFAKTAAPIIFLMLTNGLYTVVDGWFIGRFVGADALSAVTMVFPLFMVVVALATLVSGGFSSICARYLGAGEKDMAEKSLTSAIMLALLICGFLTVLYLWVGYDLTLMIADGSVYLADIGDLYISLTVYYSVLFFVVAILSDSLRCQGYLGFMALTTIIVNVLNGVCNYILITKFNMGVAGTAYGTAIAQGLAIILVIIYTYRKTGSMKYRLPKPGFLTFNWRHFLELGAPTSLTYIGVSALSGSVIYQLQVWYSDTYAVSAAAYGIINRLFTFGFMPVLGMTLAQQTIVGNNYGAGLMDRAFGSLKIGVTIAFVYCVIIQVSFSFFAKEIASLFVDDPKVISETVRFMPIMMGCYFLFGPLFMISTFFQAIGDAGRAALISLTRVYLISIPLIHILPYLINDKMGLWYAAPLTEFLGALLTVAVLWWTLRDRINLKIWLERRYNRLGAVEK